jgi:FAD dependent oxidoreductase TIGR03364
MTKNALVIGGGVLGSMHAWRLQKRGWAVTQIDRDPEPRSASVRNFGLVWVGGRRAGAELSEALQARELWDELASEATHLSVRSNGSITIARTAHELAVLEQSMQLPDAGDRGWTFLDAQDVKKLNPALRGSFLAGLHCSLDAAVEPAHILGDMRKQLLKSEIYRWIPNTEILEVSERAGGVVAVDGLGKEYSADLVIVCPGADHSTLFGTELEAAPLRKVRLQMFSTEPLGEELTTSIADGDSFRYYPAYDVPALRELPPQSPVAAAARMQLLMVQRTDGSLTIGDTHEYDEPFDFALPEPEYDHLIEVASDILGRRLPKVSRRWAGVYSQETAGEVCHRNMISPRITVVTGPGGRGNSLSPAIAENTLRMLGI